MLILSGLLAHRPLKILKQVDGNNGLEVWRQLSSLYTPRTKTRALGLLSALMSHPPFVRERTVLEQIQGMERIADEYRRSSGVDVGDDIMLTTLVKSLPKRLQEHVQLTMDENSTFQAVKERVVAYERLSTTWSKDKVYAELGAVTSYATDTGGPAAMEINQVSKGKGKGKGSKGKPSQKGKGKDKGKSKDSKGKGKSQHGGKGYATYTSKGGKGQSKNADANRCNYCNGYGHWKRAGSTNRIKPLDKSDKLRVMKQLHVLVQALAVPAMPDSLQVQLRADQQVMSTELLSMTAQ